VTINYETQIDKAYVLKEELDIKTYRVHNNGSVRNFQNVLTDIYNELNEDYNLDSINRQTEEPTETEHNQSENVS
jgi:hypothetical protein